MRRVRGPADGYDQDPGLQPPLGRGGVAPCAPGRRGGWCVAAGRVGGRRVAAVGLGPGDAAPVDVAQGQGEGAGHHGRGGGLHVCGGGGAHEGVQVPGYLLLDDAEGPVFVHLEAAACGAVFAAAAVLIHGDVSVSVSVLGFGLVRTG